MKTTSKNEIFFTDTDLARLDPNLDGQITEDEIRDVKRMVADSKAELSVQKQDVRTAFKNLTSHLQEKGSLIYFKSTGDFPLELNRENLVWATQIEGKTGDPQSTSLEDVAFSLQEGEISPCFEELIPQVYLGEDDHIYTLKDGQLTKQEVPSESPLVRFDKVAIAYAEEPKEYSTSTNWVILYADPAEGLVQFLFDPPSSLNLSDGTDWSTIQIDRVANDKAYAIFAGDKSTNKAGSLYTLEGKPYPGGFSINLNHDLKTARVHNGKEILCPREAVGACFDVSTGQRIQFLYNHVKKDGSSLLVDLNAGTVSEDLSQTLRNYDVKKTTLKLQTPGRSLDKVLLPNGDRGQFENNYNQFNCTLYTETKQGDEKVKVEWISLETNEVLLTYTVKPNPAPGQFEAAKPATGVLSLAQSDSDKRGFKFFMGQNKNDPFAYSNNTLIPLTPSGKPFPEKVEILDHTKDLWWSSESRKVYSGDGKLILTVPNADEFSILEHKGKWYAVCLIAGNNNFVTIKVYNSQQRTLVTSEIYKKPNSQLYEVFNDIDYSKLDTEGKLLIPKMAPADQPQHKEIKLQ